MLRAVQQRRADARTANTGHSRGPASQVTFSLPCLGMTRAVLSIYSSARTELGASAINPNRKIFEARKLRETAALGAGEKLVLGHPLAATIR